MHIIRSKRSVANGNPARPSHHRRSGLQFARDFFARENHIEFTLEAFLFGALLALSAWPIVDAFEALNQLQ